MAQETFALAIPFDTLSGTQKLPAYLNPSSPDYGGITIVSGVANFSVGVSDISSSLPKQKAVQKPFSFCTAW